MKIKSPCAKLRGQQIVQWVDETPNSINLEVQAEQPGWLVLADIWYPGWKATIDGVETPVLRANYLFQGGPDAGWDHRVDFSYRPLWFYLGLSVTVLSGIGLGVIYAAAGS